MQLMLFVLDPSKRIDTIVMTIGQPNENIDSWMNIIIENEQNKYDKFRNMRKLKMVIFNLPIIFVVWNMHHPRLVNTTAGRVLNLLTFTRIME